VTAAVFRALRLKNHDGSRDGSNASQGFDDKALTTRLWRTPPGVVDLQRVSSARTAKAESGFASERVLNY